MKTFEDLKKELLKDPATKKEYNKQAPYFAAVSKRIKKKIEKQKEYKQLVLARLATMPSDATLSAGKYGIFTRDQLLEEVEKESEIGEKIIEIQVKYLQKLKQGSLYKGSVITEN